MAPLYINKHSSSVVLSETNLATLPHFRWNFLTKEIGFKQLPVVWKGSLLDLVEFLY